jgi:UDP-glucose 4-epimerase
VFPSRDYVHVSDLASAHAALDWLAKGNPSPSINLGNGRGFSVTEAVQTAEKVTGRPVRTQMCPRRAGDPPVLVSDSSKARELLGWTPDYPDLDQQVAHARAWFRDKMPNV